MRKNTRMHKNVHDEHFFEKKQKMRENSQVQKKAQRIPTILRSSVVHHLNTESQKKLCQRNPFARWVVVLCPSLSLFATEATGACAPQQTPK